MHSDMDRNYTKGSLYFGIGILLIGLPFIVFRYTKDFLFENLGSVWILMILSLVLVGILIGTICMLKKMPKSRYAFDKDNVNKYFDEQDIALLYKSQSYGLYSILLLLLIGYTINISGDGLPFFWAKLAFFGSIATLNLSYYWFTKDAYDEE